jgi:hypothetical protein
MLSKQKLAVNPPNFEGSINLARELGVPAEDILDTPEKAMAYFMD